MRHLRWVLICLLTLVVGGISCEGSTTAPGLASIAVSLNATTLVVGKTLDAAAVLKDASGGLTDGHTITWSSSNTGVATINATGLITGIALGTTSITASSEGLTGSATLTVIPPPVASVAVSLSSPSIAGGQTTQATAVPRDAAGAALVGRTVSWSSSNASIATVSATGLVTGVSGGTATITASSEGVSGSATVTVTMPVATVSVSLASVSLLPGQSTQATASTKDANGVVLAGRAVVWSSSNTTVATVSATGTVTAIAAGTASIAATSEGVSGNASLGVGVVPVASVGVTLAASSITPGLTTQASATTRDAAGNVLTGRGIVWSSSNTSVATVSASGVVTAVASGTANIIATSEGRSGAAALTVSGAPVASVTVSLTSSALLVGQTTQATATMRDAGNGILTGRSVAWTSSSTAIATVNASGVVTAVAGGTATITATSEGQSGSATVTVSVAPVATVSVSLASSTIAVGGTSQATATMRDANNSVLAGRVVAWSSSNTTVATVSATGLVTAVAAGSANIVATSEGKTGSAALTVSAASGNPNEPAGLSLITQRAFNATVEDNWTLPSFAVPYFTIVQDGTAPRTPANVAQINYPAGFGGGDSPALVERDLGSSATTLYVSMWIKLSANWVGHPTGTNKVLHFWINGANRVFAFADGSGGNTLTPRIGLQAINGAYDDGFGNTSTSVDLRPNVPGQTGAQIVRGQWQRWEIVLTSNTGGSANGSADWFIDGTRVGHYTGINLVPSGASRTFDIIKWDPTWGGQGGTIGAAQQMMMDHIYISGKP